MQGKLQLLRRYYCRSCKILFIYISELDWRRGGRSKRRVGVSFSSDILGYLLQQ